MALKPSLGLPVAAFLLAGVSAAGAFAQSQSPAATASRLAGDWRSSPPLTLAASRPPLSLPAASASSSAPVSGVDQGAAPGNQSLSRMLLLLTPSAAQQQALTAELAALQNPASPEYHQWLTPSQFASSYANSASDVAAVVAWLQSQGFQVAALPAGRGWIEFSGTVAQAEQAFQTQIDLVSTAGGSARPVVTGNISVPAALQPLIGGLVSLDGIVSHPAITSPQPLSVSASQLAGETSAAAAEALTPQLQAQLVDLQSLAKSNITGAGQTIAVAASSNVNTADVAAFRAAFGLPASPLAVTLNGADPGLTGGQAEATLAASWAGAAAPGAQIVLVPAATTNATDGVDLSLAAIVDRDLASTVAVGSSACEAGMSAAHQAFYAALYQQAAVEGMAIIAAAGDSGAAACAAPGSLVSTGYGVNALASTPWNTAVGVAAFGSSGAAAGSAALSAWSPVDSADPAYAGGGGGSAVYALPAWQPIPAQVPAETSISSRLLPDLSLPTAIDSSVNPGVAFCLSGGGSAQSGCTLVRSGGSGAAAAYFAGIGALIAEQHGAQGNLAPGLYALAGRSGVFSDVQQGSAQLQCAVGSPGCGPDGHIGFSAGSGFDLATGLGVPDARTLVKAFATPQQAGTTATSVSLTASPSQASYNPSASITLTASVAQTGGTVPTGTITFSDTASGSTTVIANPVTLNSNGSASLTVEGAFASGINEMTAQYSGDGTYAPETSPQVAIDMEPSPTSLAITGYPSTVTPGQTISVVVTLTVGSPPAGTVSPSGIVTVTLNPGGETYTAQLNTAGSTYTATVPVTIPANSASTSYTLQASYPANTDYLGSNTPGPVTLNVVAVTPTVTVTPATNSPLPDSSLKLTVDVAPPQAGETAPTGTVAVYLDGSGSPSGSATLTPASPASFATITITAPATGSHTVTATYTPDTNSTNFYTSATSGAASFSISLIPTTAANNLSSNTPSLGGSITVTTTITPSSYAGTGDPTGTVTYTLNGSTVGTPANVTPGAPSVATATIPITSAGPQTLTAQYSGDTYYAASAATSTISVAKLSTTLTLSESPSSPPVGTSLQVTATVNASASNSVSPSGSVTFTLGNSTATGTVNNGVATATLTVPSAGNLTLVAQYSGDSNYSASSATAPITGIKVTPTILLTPSSYAPAVGSTLQLTVTITPPASGSTSPTGTVTFTLPNGQQQTVGVTGGSPATATLSIPTPAVGTYTLGATYSGDTNYNAATAPSIPITVVKGNTSLNVTLSTSSPTANSTMTATATLTATVSGTTLPTGTVTFYLDNGQVGTPVTLSGGTTATASFTVPSIGTHTVYASYSGDSNFDGSVSPVVPFTVAKINTTTIVVPATTSPALGASLQVSANVVPAGQISGTPPTGTITFTVNGVAASSVPLTGTLSASYTIPASMLLPGSNIISASYSGDGNYASSSATTVTVTVPKDPTTTTVTPATTTPAGGSSLGVTATITATMAGPAPPSGTVSFNLNGTTVATSAVVGSSNGTATATGVIPSINAGTQVLQAVYSGDTYFATSTSQSVPLTVSKSPTTLTIIPSTLTPQAGGSMTVTADVISSSPASAPPTGTVTIYMNNVAVGTGSVVPGTPSIATINIPLVSAGTQVLYGVYSGDTNYTGSNSTTVNITASKGATTTTVTATPPSLSAGMAETLTATIAPVNAVPGTTYTITGTVSFYDGAKLLGQVAVINNTATLSSVSLPNNVSHSITAVYSGDVNWLGSTSTILPLEATTLPDTVVLTSNYTVSPPGAAVVLTATVTPNSTPSAGSEPNPTGTVVFYYGTTIVGTAPLTPVQLSDASTATLTTQTLPGGPDQLTAYYEGDLTYDAATSNVLSITVEGFQIAPCSTNPATNVNIVQGGAGSVCFTITGEGGYNDLVQVICTPPSNDNMTCTASPQQITPPGTVTFVVQTYTTPIASATPVDRTPIWPRAAGGTALAGLLFFLLPFGRRARTLLRAGSRRMLVLVLLFAGLASLSIGCSSNTTLAPYGTPLGVATIKVTALAYGDAPQVSQSAYFTVNVVAPGTVTP